MTEHCVHRCLVEQNIELAYEKYGNGAINLVFLHGFGSGRTTWHDILEYLPASAYTIYLIDLKGFGASAKPRDGRYGIAAQARLVLNFIAGLRLSAVNLIGHSLGGAIALMAAISLLDTDDTTTLEKLIIIDGACYPQLLPKFMRYLCIPFAEQIFKFISKRIIVQYSLKSIFLDHNLITPELEARYQKYLTPPGTCYAMTAMARQLQITDYNDVINQYHKLNLPTLIVWGGKDRILSPEMGQRLAQELPNAILAIIDDCGHNPHEEQPFKTWMLLNNFLVPKNGGGHAHACRLVKH